MELGKQGSSDKAQLQSLVLWGYGWELRCLFLNINGQRNRESQPRKESHDNSTANFLLHRRIKSESVRLKETIRSSLRTLLPSNEGRQGWIVGINAFTEGSCCSTLPSRCMGGKEGCFFHMSSPSCSFWQRCSFLLPGQQVINRTGK